MLRLVAKGSQQRAAVPPCTAHLRVAYAFGGTIAIAWVAACGHETFELLPEENGAFGGTGAAGTPGTVWSGGAFGTGAAPSGGGGALGGFGPSGGISPQGGDTGEGFFDCSSCEPAFEVCDVPTASCVDRCATDDECRGMRALCDTMQGICVECFSEVECFGTGPGLCIFGVCAECLNQGDCAAPKPICQPGTFRCVECTSSEHCSRDEYCDRGSFSCMRPNG